MRLSFAYTTARFCFAKLVYLHVLSRARQHFVAGIGVAAQPFRSVAEECRRKPEPRIARFLAVCVSKRTKSHPEI